MTSRRIVAAVAALLGLSCGQGSAAPVCNAGQTVACRCSDVALGNATCDADGASFGECSCGPSGDGGGGSAAGGGGSASGGGSSSSATGGSAPGGGGGSASAGGGGAQELPWSFDVDTTGANGVLPAAVRVDSAGDPILLTRLDTSDFGSGPISGFGLLAYTPSGTLSWRQVFPDSYVDGVNGDVDLAVGTPDQIYVGSAAGDSVDRGCGARNGGESLARFDAQGKCVFDNVYGDTMQARLYVAGLAVDGSGNLIAEVAYRAMVDLGEGPEANGDLAIMKLDPNGNLVWIRRFNLGDPANLAGIGRVAASANGNIAFAATGPSIDLGQGPVTGSGSSALFVGTLDANGAVVRVKPFDAGPNVTGIAVDDAGDIAISVPGPGGDFGTGLFPTHSNGVLVAVYGPNLDARFVDVLDNQVRYSAGDVSFGPDGSCYAIGSFVGNADLAGKMVTANVEQIYVARLDIHGVAISVRTWTNAFDVGTLAIDPAGSPVISGQFASGVNFGQSTLISQFGGGTFLARLTP